MSINILNYRFEELFENPSCLQNQSGVYVILGNNGGNHWDVIDVGESDHVKTRVENHDRAMCWQKCGYHNLNVAVFYTYEHERMAIEKQIRQQFNPPCGER